MSSELASGKLKLDEPAAGVARLTIANAAKRGAFDQEMLDAIADGRRRARRPLPDSHRRGPDVLLRL